MRRLFIGIVVAMTLSANALSAQNTPLVECHLRLTATDAYTGRCLRQDTTVAMLALHPATPPQTGRWRGINARVFGRGGDSADVIDWTAFSPAMVDVGTANGVFASGLGWFRVRQAAFDSAGLRFSADAKDAAPATLEDLRILRTARGYFSDATRWNRVDTRRSAIVTCPAAPAARTLFCAFYVASQEIAGEFFGGRPAGAALQAAIRSASPRRYQHPLTDFNNDSLVTFVQIQAVFDDAIRRMESEVRTP